MNQVWVAGKRVRLDAAQMLGSGGEAEVYGLPGGMALKLYKAGDHADYAGNPHAQAAARLRLAQAADTLRGFPLPAQLPDHIIQPLAPATDSRGAVVGYLMRQVPRSIPLARLSDPASRQQGWDEAQVLAVFRDLHAQVSALHRAGVVIGDFNDYNVLVDSGAAYLIDVDSVQLPGRVAVQYTPRFLDPLLARAEGSSMVLTAPYGPEADWYAFAALLLQSLLFVGPYGGLYRPAALAQRLPEALRPAHRLSVFHPEVRYPKAARPLESLPESLEAHFRGVFLHDRRQSFPAALLDSLHWTCCIGCGLVHGRGQCPRCRVHVPTAPVVRHGTVVTQRMVAVSGVLAHVLIETGHLRWVAWEQNRYVGEAGQVYGIGGYDSWVRVSRQGDRVWLGRDGVAIRDREILRVDSAAGVPQIAVAGDRLLWLADGRLWEETPLGARPLGQVLAGRSYLWGGDGRALVYSEAGAVSAAWLATPGQLGLLPVSLPRQIGSLERIHCVFGQGYVWLFLARREQGRVQHACLVFDLHGQLVATEQAEEGAGSWLDAPWGAMAAGHSLYVAADCLLRIDVEQGRLQVARSFPDTAPYVDSSVTLLPGHDGIYVVRRSSVDRLVQR